MVDFTTYQPPGVYIEDTTTPLVNTTGVPPTVVCLIGPSLGYQTQTDVLTLAWNATLPTPAGVPIPFSKRGAYLSATSGGTSHTSASIPAPVVTRADTGAALVEGTDYSLSFDISAGGGVNNGVATITTLSALLDGIKVVVVYNYTDTAYASPQVFDNYSDLVGVYGTPLALTAPTDPNASQVVSPLSLGAKIAFENGANQVLAVALDPSISNLNSAFTNAYSKVETDFRVSVIVPLFVEVTTTTATTGLSNVEALAASLLTSVTTATNEGFPRTAIFGASKGLTNAAGTASAGVADFVSLAQSVHSSRVAMAYPNVLNLFNGSSGVNQVTEVDGVYLAAAYAGALASNPVNQGLTRQAIRSFAGLPARVQKLQTKSFKDTLSRSGVAVSEINRNNLLVCRHGVTTDMTSVITREVSITRQGDSLYALLQDGLDASGLVGSPITLDTLLSVKGVVTGILENAVSNQVIVAYQDALVRQQTIPSGDPTAIEIKFAWLPAVPLNYLLVSFSIDLNSGNFSGLTTSQPQ